MVFSRFLSMTIFIPAENTRHSEKPGQNSVLPKDFLKIVWKGGEVILSQDR
jgi:hypothetical protein